MKKNNIQRIITLWVAPLLLVVSISAQSPDTRKSSSTRQAAIGLMKLNSPRLAVDTTMNASQMAAWRGEMSDAMRKLMKHPEKETAAPRKIGEAQREGYRIERWQSYPLPGATVNFYVLIPDGVSAEKPARGGVLCIPGFGQTKELVAGEKEGVYDLSAGADTTVHQGSMARHFVKTGLVAVAVDNPSFGELSDNGVADYLNTSRILLEEDWSYLGLASWQDKVILDWLKRQPYLDKEKIIVSGFSLGTEPLMVLGLLDNDIFAFVYNDFLCRTRERIFVVDKPDENGKRPFPNSIEHLIPGFLKEFDFPDIVAALAPRPLICTEGGLDRDFGIVQTAYMKSGAPEAFTYHHYQKYENPENRKMLNATELPGNLNPKEYFDLTNVDSPRHYFKTEHIMPWLEIVLGDDDD
ncbi:MAG: hypothetical protein J1E38_01380 [Paramuribaculum sp.]|nr:hypothetical protein [Paramuribaculum sp.]